MIPTLLLRAIHPMRRQPVVVDRQLVDLGRAMSSVRKQVETSGSRTARPTVGTRRLLQLRKTTAPAAHDPPFVVSLFNSCGRAFSTRRDRNSEKKDDSWKNLYAIPFKVSPEQALDKFSHWTTQEQGLRYLLSWSSVRIGAAYVPMWSFDFNIRFVRTDVDQKIRRYDWKPALFQAAYGGKENKVIHLPGLSAYAGHSYRRSLIDPVHGQTLVFLGSELVPFGKWMLRDMRVGDNVLSVTPDPWNATRGRALALVQEDLQQLAEAAMMEENADPSKVQVQTQVTASRRVYLPTYFIDYKLLGTLEYRAFISGCDAGAPISGVSHKVMDFSNDELQQMSGSILSGAMQAAQTFARVATSNRQAAGLTIVLLQFLASLVGRVMARIPIIGIPFLGVLGFRKIIQPWMDNRWATAEWERQREHEALMEEGTHSDVGMDFVDFSGSAERFFHENRQRILDQLGGKQEHHGDYDFYADWERWARDQWERQQQQQRTYGRQQQQQQRTQKQKPKKAYQWDFDPNDPYSVLGIHKNATKTEVSAAFRKQMLMHHPDRQPSNATEAERERANERSKLITEAYRTIKAGLKR